MIQSLRAMNAHIATVMGNALSKIVALAGATRPGSANFAKTMGRGPKTRYAGHVETLRNAGRLPAKGIAVLG